jgi:hypothetical protein
MCDGKMEKMFNITDQLLIILHAQSHSGSGNAICQSHSKHFILITFDTRASVSDCNHIRYITFSRGLNLVTVFRPHR